MKTGTILLSSLCALTAITLVSAQDSLNVSQVGQIILPVNQLVLQNNHAYTSSGSDRVFYDVDVSNPAAPFVADSCSIGYIGQYPGWNTCLHGDYAYIPGYSHLSIVDLNQMAQVYFDTSGQNLRLEKMAVSGDMACAIGSDSTWEQMIFKVLGFDGYMPYVVGECIFTSPYSPREIVIQGNYAYLACDLYGLQIVNISDPTHPTMAGHLYTPGYAWGLAVQGNYVYMAEHYAGLRIIDVSDPEAPHQVGTCILTGSTQGVAVIGSTAYVADGVTGGLRIVDVSDPTTPIEIGWYDSPGCAHHLAVNGGYIYMADYPYLGIYNFVTTLPVPPPAPVPSAAAFALGSAYPNPFNPSTVIRYQTQQASQVSLKIYDTAGRLVETLADSWREAGSYQTVFDGAEFPAGIYLYRLTAGSRGATGKMALVK